MTKEKVMTVNGVKIKESMLQSAIAEMMDKGSFTASVFESSLRKNHAFVKHIIQESNISVDYVVMRVVDRMVQKLRKEGRIAFNKDRREWTVLKKK